MTLAQPLTREAVRAACRFPGTADAVGAPDELSMIERTVIAVGAADARRGLWVAAKPDGRLRRLTDLLMGRRTPIALADPRLDALRRFAQTAASGRERISDIRRVRDAGFSSPQIVLAARLSRTAY